MLDGDVASMIKRILTEAGIRGRRASMSIPLFSSFFTTLEMPVMSQDELQEAIPYQAQQIVPVPISEVILDWEIIGKTKGESDGAGGARREKLSVLLVAVPREVVDNSVRIAKLVELELSGLEVEAFSLVRALLHNDRRAAMIIDIGARSTNMIIVDGGMIRSSRTIDVSGSELTTILSRSLGVELGRAEAVKIDHGIAEDAPQDIRRMLTTVLDSIVNEAEKIMVTYRRQYGRAVETLLLAGGSASLRGLDRYFTERFGVPATRANPFQNLHVPEELNPVLAEIGPSFAVAVGLALRNVVEPAA